VEISEGAAIDVTKELERLRGLVPAADYERAWEQGRQRTLDDVQLLLAGDGASTESGVKRVSAG